MASVQYVICYCTQRNLIGPHCSKLKMNGKKLSRFQFHFLGLLETKQVCLFVSNREDTYYSITAGSSI